MVKTDSGMSRPTPLQVSLMISLLFHVAMLGTYELYKSWPDTVAALPKNNSTDGLTMAIVAAPEKTSAPASIQQPAPARKSMPLQSAMTSPPVAPSPQPLEPKVAAPVMTPVPAPVISSSKPAMAAAPTMVVFDAPAKPRVQAARAVKARPDYLKNSPPIYPAAARHRHEEGLVLLAVEVADDGHAARVGVEKSSGFELLDDAAVEAVLRWEFQPARIGPVAVASRVSVPIRFELTEP
jgi:periplasmic protein TonB